MFMFINQNFTIRDSDSETYRKIGAHILKKTEILVIITSEKTENVVEKIRSLVVLLNLEEN